jgi:hypothetical protein
VNSALAGVSGQQEQLQGRLAGLADTTEALKEQLAALQVRTDCWLGCCCLCSCTMPQLV